jgi:hypothetical protein
MTQHVLPVPGDFYISQWSIAFNVVAVPQAAEQPGTAC